MNQKLPDLVIQVIVKALQEGILIQRQARLCDLAALDAIPSEILPWLKLNHQKAITKSSVTSERILADLARSENKLAQLSIFKNQNISPSILTILSVDTDNEIHRMVLQHPKTPGEILIKFSQYFRNECYRDYTTISQEAASRPSTNSETLRKLSQSENWRVRTRVAKNPSTPVDVLEILANDPFDYDGGGAAFVRQGVAENLAASIEILEKLAEDSSQSVRNSVASNPNTPKFLLEHLLANKLAIYGIISNPLAPGHILADIATLISNDGWLEDIAKHPNTPSVTLAKLSTRNVGMWSNRLRITVAKNPNTHPETLKDLATDPYKEILPNGYGYFSIQIAVASNPSTPIEVLEFFYQEKDLFICQGLAKNPNTPINLLRNLAVEENYIVRKYQKNNPLKMEIKPFQINVLKHNYVYNLYMGNSLAKNPSTPIEILEKLAEHGDSCIKLDIAKNSSTPLDLLEKLSHCKDRYLKKNTLNRIHSIYREIAANPETSTQQLQEMLKHLDIEVRLAVTLHPQGLNLLLDRCLKPEKYLLEENSLNRVLAGMHPQISKQQIENLFHSKNWFDRLAVTCNPQIPKEYLEKLTQDKCNTVKQTAKELLKLKN